MCTQWGREAVSTACIETPRFAQVFSTLAVFILISLPSGMGTHGAEAWGACVRAREARYPVVSTIGRVSRIIRVAGGMSVSL